MFAVMCAVGEPPSDVLMAVAREFSPRVEACGPGEVALDVSGLSRLIGDGKAVAAELRRTALERGIHVRVAIADTRTAARLLVHEVADRAGPPHDEVKARAATAAGTRAAADDAVIVIDPGAESAALAHLPIEALAILIPDPFIRTLRRWGLRTLGELASLPPAAVAARLGRSGVAWQRLARGEDSDVLVPAVPDERFEQALDLEWPIEGLEPLSFVLGRLMEPLSAHLERRDRGAAVLHVRLHLVTRELHERSLQLPAPIRDARTLRTLALLDLESHPPTAAIDRVVVAVDPTPGRVVQFSLLTRPLPSPEQLSTLMARLHALMGEGRCGTAVVVDSWEPGAFAMRPFAPSDMEMKGQGSETTHSASSSAPVPVVAFRRFRFPVAARVRVDRGVPVQVLVDRRGWSGGHVEIHAGPWRASGGWWIDGPATGKSWEREEWDVTLSDGATYRLFRERDTEAWFIEGVLD